MIDLSTYYSPHLYFLNQKTAANAKLIVPTAEKKRIKYLCLRKLHCLQ
jgi:hypothetical protein